MPPLSAYFIFQLYRVFHGKNAQKHPPRNNPPCDSISHKAIPVLLLFIIFVSYFTVIACLRSVSYSADFAYFFGIFLYFSYKKRVNMKYSVFFETKKRAPLHSLFRHNILLNVSFFILYEKTRFPLENQGILHFNTLSLQRPPRPNF